MGRGQFTGPRPGYPVKELQDEGRGGSSPAGDEERISGYGSESDVRILTLLDAMHLEKAGLTG